MAKKIETEVDELMDDVVGPESESTLMLLLIGPRASGKSSSIGTSGKRTFYITARRERHGINAARLLGGKNIVGWLTDVAKDGSLLSSDNSLQRLHTKLDQLLERPKIAQEFPVIAFDGFSVFDEIIQDCKAVKIRAAANNYDKGPAVIEQFMMIVDKLLALRYLGCEIIATVAASAETQPSGEYTNVVPHLQGYKCVDKIIGCFDDIAMVGRVAIEDDQGAVKQTHCFQFNGLFEKTGKTVSGKQVGINFSPRITGVASDALPGLMNANLAELSAFKRSHLDNAVEAEG